MNRRQTTQDGVALVNAIFLLVVLAALGAFMVSIGGGQTTATLKSLQAARVYFGSKAGTEWAIHRAINVPLSMCSSSGSATSTSFTLAGSGFVGVSVSVNCSFSTHTEGSQFNVHFIRSTATTGSRGDVEYAERRLEATASNRT